MSKEKEVSWQEELTSFNGSHHDMFNLMVELLVGKSPSDDLYYDVEKVRGLTFYVEKALIKLNRDITETLVEYAKVNIVGKPIEKRMSYYGVFLDYVKELPVKVYEAHKTNEEMEMWYSRGLYPLCKYYGFVEAYRFLVANQKPEDIDRLTKYFVALSRDSKNSVLYKEVNEMIELSRKTGGQAFEIDFRDVIKAFSK